jgi:hypothetical protein
VPQPSPIPSLTKIFRGATARSKSRTRSSSSFYFDEAKSQLSLSTKLPQSSEVALLLPFATPTGYGLARSGWVTAAFGPQDDVPVDMLTQLDRRELPRHRPRQAPQTARRSPPPSPLHHEARCTTKPAKKSHGHEGASPLSNTFL